MSCRQLQAYSTELLLVRSKNIIKRKKLRIWRKWRIIFQKKIMSYFVKRYDFFYLFFHILSLYKTFWVMTNKDIIIFINKPESLYLLLFYCIL